MHEDVLYLTGTIELSRSITEEELNQLRKILCEGATHYKNSENVLDIMDSFFVETETRRKQEIFNEEIRAFNDWCKEKGITVSDSSYIRCSGYASKAYYMENGVFCAHSMTDYHIWSADTDTLIRELTRRGVWQKRAEKKKGGKE